VGSACTRLLPEMSRPPKQNGKVPVKRAACFFIEQSVMVPVGGRLVSAYFLFLYM
jgi:hypothetical protein